MNDIRQRYATPCAAGVVGVIALVVAACTSPGTTAPPSTFGVGSPWLGTFTAVGLPAPVNSLTALDCADSTRCWAVGSTVGGAGVPNGAAVIATADGGGRWAAEVIPPTVGYLSGISCSSVRSCTAVGQAGQASGGQAAVITTTDGGGRWVPVPVPTGILDLTAVSCQADGRCVAVGTAATGTVSLVSTSSGTAWVQAGTLPATMSGPSSVSCAGNLHCWVTGHTSVALDHVAGAGVWRPVTVS